MKRWAGLDVGKSGALVSITEDNEIEIVPYDMENYREALERWKADDLVVACENVHSMPAQGVASSFAFGENFGWLQGLTYGLRVKTFLVPPQVWKRSFGLLLNKKASTQEKKQRTIETVKRLYPNVSLKRTPKSRTDDDNIADAIMIATFCRKEYP